MPTFMQQKMNFKVSETYHSTSWLAWSSRSVKHFRINKHAENCIDMLMISAPWLNYLLKFKLSAIVVKSWRYKILFKFWRFIELKKCWFVWLIGKFPFAFRFCRYFYLIWCWNSYLSKLIYSALLWPTKLILIYLDMCLSVSINFYLREYLSVWHVSNKNYICRHS